MSHVRNFHNANTIILELPASETAQRSGVAEQVQVADPNAVALLKKTIGWQVIRRVFDVTLENLGQDLDDLACKIVWHCKHLTEYWLRRGGASWHNATLDSMDATTYMDCLALSRTAWQDICQALVDSERLNLSSKAQRQVARLRTALKLTLSHISPQHWVGTKPCSHHHGSNYYASSQGLQFLDPVLSLNFA